MDAVNASASQPYDTWLVLQGGAEATSQHGIPNLQPLTSSLEAIEDGERKAATGEENSSTVVNDLNHCKVKVAEESTIISDGVCVV